MSERIMHGLRVCGSPFDPSRESHYHGGGPADRINVSIDGNVTANKIEYRVSCLLRLYYWTDHEDEQGALMLLLACGAALYFGFPFAAGALFVLWLVS